MNERTLPPEGCHRCSTPVSDTDPSLPTPVLSDTGSAYVLLCPDCAGPNRDATQFDLDDEFGTPADVAECWTCEGQGDVPSYVDTDGVTQTRECPMCHGTGMRGAA